MLSGRPHSVIWTSGATEGANTVLRHFSQEKGEIWISAIEHPCIMETASRLYPERLRLIPVDQSGITDLEWLRDQLRRTRPVLVAVMAANNETGVLQPWSEIADLCREYEVPYLCDASQWIGKLPSLGLGRCSFITGCAHKFGGPLGVGFLHASDNFAPLLIGGPQEEGRRAGTENLPGVLAMLATLRSRESELANGSAEVRNLWKQQFVSDMTAVLPGTAVVGFHAPALWNTVSAILPEVDCRARWVVKIDKLGAAASTGSACSSGQEKPSHVLSAMGFSSSQASRVIRFSSGWETQPEDWQQLTAVLSRAATELLSAPLH